MAADEYSRSYEVKSQLSFSAPSPPSSPPRGSSASSPPPRNPRRASPGRSIPGRPRSAGGGREAERPAIGEPDARRGDLTLIDNDWTSLPFSSLRTEAACSSRSPSRSAVLMEFWWKKNKKPQLHPTPGFPSPENQPGSQPRSSSIRIASEMLHTSISPSSLIRLKWVSFVIRIAFA